MFHKKFSFTVEFIPFLINTYQSIKDNVEELIKLLGVHRNEEYLSQVFNIYVI